MVCLSLFQILSLDVMGLGMCMIVALALTHVEYLKEIVMVMMIALVISYAEKITVTILFHQMLIAATTLLQVSRDAHPWAGEDLSLKIDECDQTIWICIIEL